MAAIAQDEAVTADNPLIFFAYQQDGRLKDLFALSRSVHRIDVSGAVTQVIANAALNVTDAPTGVRIGEGIYHANFTATSYTAGTYEIRWQYQVESTSAVKTNRQKFEVLDSSKFGTGAQYVGYATSADLRAVAPFTLMTAGDAQKLIDTASRRIEALTSRFFEPRLMTQKLNGRGTVGQELFEPIIGVNKLQIVSNVTGVDVALNEVSLDGIAIYARHLQGLNDPDDRDDPRIEITGYGSFIFQSLNFFPKGPQSIWITGVFGYTDPDGGPMGITPPPLFRVVGSFATKLQADPFGQDKTIVTPHLVTKAKTRDQEINYSSSSYLLTSQTTITGDPFVDEILARYVRPAHFGAV